MKKVKTKDRIVEVALVLFNENGIKNVRLQDIADGTGISVGNLAYHYYSKEAILLQIDRQLSDRISPIISQKTTIKHLLDFDNQLARYYHLLVDYSFYFLDLLELRRNHPKLDTNRQVYINRITQQVREWLHFIEDKGVIMPEPRKRQYDMVAHTVWIIIAYWLTQPFVDGIPEDRERVFKDVVWSQIYPYFSDNGKLEFELVIGKLLDRGSFIKMR